MRTRDASADLSMTHRRSVILSEAKNLASVFRYAAADLSMMGGQARSAPLSRARRSGIMRLGRHPSSIGRAIAS